MLCQPPGWAQYVELFLHCALNSRRTSKLKGAISTGRPLPKAHTPPRGYDWKTGDRYSDLSSMLAGTSPYTNPDGSSWDSPINSENLT